MVSCAYVVKGQPSLGFLFDVLTGDVYAGGQGMPSTKNGESFFFSAAITSARTVCFVTSVKPPA